jgi:U2 small nuclear ribonucleoprotein B''
VGRIWCVYTSFQAVIVHTTNTAQQIAYAKTKSDTIAKLDGTYKMPEPEREDEPEQVAIQEGGFGAAPAKAVPVNAPDTAVGQKRARDEEEEDEDEDAEMEMDVSDEDSD